MTEFIGLMGKPLLACLILLGIHVYLGLHVVARGVIFVDLALAQIAALGMTFGALWGFDLHSNQNYILSLGFTLLGALFFAFTRQRKSAIPHEAIIGIVYAVAASASILALSRSPAGGEDLTSIMVGHLLFVTTTDIVKIFFLYVIIGIIHWLIRKPLIEISTHPDRAFTKGFRVRWFDFLFYATFGLVVTNSVKIAGVLLVFCYLIIPAVSSMLLAGRMGSRLLAGWGFGIAASVMGLMVSYYCDLPTGAAIVCTFGLCLAILSVGKSVLSR